MTTYAVLQKLPPEALDANKDEWRYGAANVLMVGTKQEAETFLADYREHHRAAGREWRSWDSNKSWKWDSTFDRKHDEICEHYAVSTLIEDVVFEIVPVGFDAIEKQLDELNAGMRECWAELERLRGIDRGQRAERDESAPLN